MVSRASEYQQLCMCCSPECSKAPECSINKLTTAQVDLTGLREALRNLQVNDHRNKVESAPGGGRGPSNQRC